LVNELSQLCPNSKEAVDLKKALLREIRENEDLSHYIQMMRDTIVPPGETKQKLEMVRDSLGYPPFKVPQESVCWEAVTSTNDIFFVAPCGFGKSACFTIPAVISGGLTLVIEPFKAQIESQLESLRGMRPIVAEKLLTVKEAKIKGQLSAVARLQELTKQKLSNVSNPLIIFATPELVHFTESLDALSTLSRQGRLKRIVVDEFDVVEDSKEKYREAYLDLFPKIREQCRFGGKAMQIMSLTATVTKRAIVASRESADESSPGATFFLSQRALPDHHKFSVEQKV
jgi:superfamily II DNA helicase RecQ